MRKNIHLPDALVEQIDEWRHLHKYKTETSAIIDLIGVGLSAGANGYVYLAESEDGECLKIGFTQNVNSRVRSLRSPSGAQCHCIAVLSGGRQLERIAHAAWATHRIQGEWFENTPLIKQWFENHPLSLEAVEADTSLNNEVLMLKVTTKHAQMIKDAARKNGLTMPEFVRVSAIENAIKSSEVQSGR